MYLTYIFLPYTQGVKWNCTGNGLRELLTERMHHNNSMECDLLLNNTLGASCRMCQLLRAHKALTLLGVFVGAVFAIQYMNWQGTVFVTDGTSRTSGRRLGTIAGAGLPPVETTLINCQVSLSQMLDN